MNRRITIAILLVFISGVSYATPILESWTNSSTEGWLIMDDNEGATPYGSLSWAATLGGRDGVLQITGGAYTNMPKEDRVYASTNSSSGVFAGNTNWSGGGAGGVGYQVKFDFYSDSKIPQQLDVFFVGRDQYAWYYSITPALGWSHFEVAFGASGWYTEDGGADFSQDLADVDQLGVRIYYNFDGGDTDGGLIYGLDDFDVDSAIPEPGTWMFLGFSLVSLCYTFRAKLNHALETVKNGLG